MCNRNCDDGCFKLRNVYEKRLNFKHFPSLVKTSGEVYAFWFLAKRMDFVFRVWERAERMKQRERKREIEDGRWKYVYRIWYKWKYVCFRHTTTTVNVCYVLFLFHKLNVWFWNLCQFSLKLACWFKQISIRAKA